MFFKKKKKEVLLNHGLLAEALMSLAVRDWHDFETKAKQVDKDGQYNLTIRKDEHIKFELSGFDVGHYSYSFVVYTYVDKIQVNRYFFSLDKKNYGLNFWKEWELCNKSIYHPLPGCIIEQINDYSAFWVDTKHQQLNAEKKKVEARKQSIWQKEEVKLKEVFKNYEQK
ncbi:MAG: hypothetical protein ACLSVX_01540 [Massilimicrobiota timonensis]